MNQKRVAAMMGAVLALAAPAWSAPLPAEQYRALVRDCRTFLAGREISEAGAKKFAAKLRAVSSVTLPSGAPVSVDTKADADALDAISGTTPDKKLLARFEALDESLSTPAGAVKGDPAQLAKAVLSANEFTSSRPKGATGDGWDWSFLPKWARPIEKFLKPALQWIGKGLVGIGKWFVKQIENFFRAIGRFFRWLFNKLPQNKFNWNPKNPFASVGNGVLLTLYFLATVAGVVGVYFLSRYLFDVYAAKTGRGRRAGSLGGDLDLTAEGITDPLGAARDHAEGGDYRSAIRLTYIASLWKLGESGLLTLEKNRTNGEYQRALRKKSSTVHDDFLPATRLFDRVWYGKQAATKDEFDLVSAIHDKLPTQDAANAVDTPTTGAPETKP